MRWGPSVRWAEVTDRVRGQPAVEGCVRRNQQAGSLPVGDHRSEGVSAARETCIGYRRGPAEGSEDAGLVGRRCDSLALLGAISPVQVDGL